MKRIIVDNDSRTTIHLSEVNDGCLIFAKKNGRFAGMLVLELKHGGWILRTGGECGATGHHSTVKKCIESCIPYGYEFFVEE